MLDLMRVAVTGGIATGKTSICQIFQELGAYCVSSDRIVHQLLLNDKPFIQSVKLIVGNQVVINGVVDRKKVAEVVFSSPEKLQMLEELTHPLVQREIEREYEEVKHNKKYAFYLVEVPLLFEKHLNGWYDYTLTVVTKEEIAVERFKKETSYSEEEYFRRKSVQMDQFEKAKRSDFVIANNASYKVFRMNSETLFNLINLKAKPK